jgi:hypothetical protein
MEDLASPGKYERFKAKPEEIKPKRRVRRKRLHAPNVRFVKGTVSFPVLGQAWRLHHAAPLVLLAIKSEVDIQRWRTDDDNSEVAVTASLCSQLGLSRDARLRAVKALEGAGLLTATWTTRRAPRVRLAPDLFEEGKITVSEP